ncbi:MAG: stage II sporulation protein M [Deltaproteobacteria bacterium]|nr:stage II sporulation protein M [Deltaproteobacteria bacterium]
MSHSDAFEMVQHFGEELDNHQRLRERRDGSVFTQSFALVEHYEVLTSYLYTLRSTLPVEHPFRRQIEEKVTGFGQRLSLLQVPKKPSISFTVRYRNAWKDNLSLFVFTAVFFLITNVVGWQIATTDPTAISIIIPQSLLEEILDKARWFDTLQKNPIIGGLGIAVNNIKVSIYCCVLGALMGLGGVWILAYNGLLFGGILGFCYINQFHRELLGFVVGHGPLELSIIVSSAFAGFLIGRVFFMRPYRLFSLRMRLAASDAGIILTGILPWLTLAAFIEAGISPWPMLSDELKIAIGTIAAAAFWIWTLLPTTTFESRSASVSRDE